MNLDLDALQKAAEAATPGPWTSEPVMLAGSNGNKSWCESTGRIINGPPQTVERETLSARWFAREEDADFIAAANPAVVLELVRRLEFYRLNEKHLEKVIDDRTHDVQALSTQCNALREQLVTHPPHIAALVAAGQTPTPIVLQCTDEQVKELKALMAKPQPVSMGAVVAGHGIQAYDSTITRKPLTEDMKALLDKHSARLAWLAFNCAAIEAMTAYRSGGNLPFWYVLERQPAPDADAPHSAAMGRCLVFGESEVSIEAAIDNAMERQAAGKEPYYV